LASRISASRRARSVVALGAVGVQAHGGAPVQVLQRRGGDRLLVGRRGGPGRGRGQFGQAVALARRGHRRQRRAAGARQQLQRAQQLALQALHPLPGRVELRRVARQESAHLRVELRVLALQALREGLQLLELTPAPRCFQSPQLGVEQGLMEVRGHRRRIVGNEKSPPRAGLAGT
jgi:hypothetical protein